MTRFENPPYYITAYGLAVKRGFMGTLDEWIASLKGEKGDRGDKVELRRLNDKIQWRRTPNIETSTDEAPIDEMERNDIWYDLVTLKELQGEHGYSPTVTLTDIDGGVRVTVTDVNGTESTDITAAKIGAVPAIESAEYPGCYYRYFYNQLEWINPPMIPGVEYRTVEQYNDEPVYAILVDFGYLPNSMSKSMLYAPEPTLVKDIVYLSGVTDDGLTLPYITSIGNNVYAHTDGGMLTVYAVSDRSDYKAKFLIKYTKKNNNLG